MEKIENLLNTKFVNSLLKIAKPISIIATPIAIIISCVWFISSEFEEIRKENNESFIIIQNEFKEIRRENFESFMIVQNEFEEIRKENSESFTKIQNNINYNVFEEIRNNIFEIEKDIIILKNENNKNDESDG